MLQNIPQVEESKKFNLITSIWLVPFVALMIAGWLAYQYYAQLGPEIKIIFPKNEGLQAGQSRIKYKDVPIGKVTKIQLQNDGNGVVVFVRIDKTAKRFLNENTKFWIVKAEVSMGGVSGLDTLISGTYINMFTQEGVEQKRIFRGLSHAYREDKQGEYFHLYSPQGYHIKEGTPIYFNNLQAGAVEYVHMALDGKGIAYEVYINKAFIPYLHTDSKFWVSSMVDVDLSHGKLNVNVAPLSQLIQGALSFSSSGEDSSRTIPEKFSFHLYPNHTRALSKRIGEGGDAIKYFELHTRRSIAKLKEGASVEYEGFEVGSVKRIALSYDPHSHQMEGRVLLTIDTSAFRPTVGAVHTGEENFYQAITEGLRAKISQTDPISGTLFVSLCFEENQTQQPLTQGEQYPLLPMSQTQERGLMETVEAIATKLNDLKLEALITSLDTLLQQSQAPIENLNTLLVELKQSAKDIHAFTNQKSFRAMPNAIEKSLKTLTQTLKTTQRVVKGYKSNSLIMRKLTQTLKAVTRGSDQLEIFFKMLNRKPNSLIFGDK